MQTVAAMPMRMLSKIGWIPNQKWKKTKRKNQTSVFPKLIHTHYPHVYVRQKRSGTVLSKPKASSSFNIISYEIFILSSKMLP